MPISKASSNTSCRSFSIALPSSESLPAVVSSKLMDSISDYVVVMLQQVIEVDLPVGSWWCQEPDSCVCLHAWDDHTDCMPSFGSCTASRCEEATSLSITGPFCVKGCSELANPLYRLGPTPVAAWIILLCVRAVVAVRECMRFCKWLASQNSREPLGSLTGDAIQARSGKFPTRHVSHVEAVAHI